MKGSVKLPVFIDDARKYVNTTQLRAKYLGASYEAEYCQWQMLHGLGSLMETASLIITPNAYLEGKLIASYPPDPIGDFDVTRATTATRVNSAGLVELVPYNVVQYSQEYSNSSFWSYYVSSVSANTATAPDGTLTADTLTLSATNGSTYQSFASQNAATFNLSTYFKKTNEDVVYMDCSSSGGYFGASFNLTTQAITTFGGGFSPLIESVGNGWYRCSVNGFVSGSGAFGVGVYSTAGQSAYIWGTQLNEGGLKDYQKTETRLNIPRLDYSNGTCPSLLVEPQRTNLALYSSSFDNAAWGLTGGVTITANNTISPSGVQDADRYIESTNANYAYEFVTDVSGTFTASLYVKKASSSTIGFGLVAGGFSGGMSVKFNLDTQTFSTPINYGNFSSITASYEALDNGWYRLILRGTTATATSYYFVIGSLQESYAANTFVWGAQLEAGSYATSYIPTTSASVTRNADVVSKTGISSLIGQTEGTMFVDVDFTEVSDYNGWFMKDVANFDTFAFIQREASGIIAVGYYGSGALQARIETAPSQPIGRYKIGFGYKNNDFVLYINGTQIGTDTSGSVSGLMNFLDAHYSSTGSTLQNSIALWKTRLTNTQLQTLTSI